VYVQDAWHRNKGALHTLFVPRAAMHMVTISIMALFYYSMRFS